MTNCSRGTSSMARSTFASMMPRRRRSSRNCIRPMCGSPDGETKSASPMTMAKALQPRTNAYQNAAARLPRTSPLCVYATQTVHDLTQRHALFENLREPGHERLVGHVEAERRHGDPVVGERR